MEAINKKKMEPVINIVKHGFPVNEPIMYGGVNLLMHAAGNCTEEELGLIMTLQPDVNQRDNLGRTAMHFACRAGNLGTFRILNDHDDTDIDAVTNAGVTPLMMAIESGKIQLVAECLNNNFNPFLRDALDRTAVDYAMQYRDRLGHDMRELISKAME